MAFAHEKQVIRDAVEKQHTVFPLSNTAPGNFRSRTRARQLELSLAEERTHMSIEQLRGMIGLSVSYHGSLCCVVEVLEDGPALVLVDQSDGISLQTDQYGDPRRQVPATYVVPVWERSGDALHEEFLSLELLEGRCH
jgi:hypothetical protein